jgi:hypothetical protein
LIFSLPLDELKKSQQLEGIAKEFFDSIVVSLLHDNTQHTTQQRDNVHTHKSEQPQLGTRQIGATTWRARAIHLKCKNKTEPDGSKTPEEDSFSICGPIIHSEHLTVTGGRMVTTRKMMMSQFKSIDISIISCASMAEDELLISAAVMSQPSSSV